MQKISPLTLPSAQGRQGHTHRIALRFPLSSTRGEGKEEYVSDMNQNIFNDTDFSRFTSLFPPYSPIALLPYKEWQMDESL